MTTIPTSFWDSLDPIPPSSPPSSSGEDFEEILGTPPEVDFSVVDHCAQDTFDKYKGELDALLEKREFVQILEKTASLETLPKISQALAHLYRGMAFEEDNCPNFAILSAEKGLALAPEEFDPDLAVKLYVLKTSNLFRIGAINQAHNAASQGLQVEGVTNQCARDLLVTLQWALT